MQLDELTASLPEARNVGRQTAKALEQIGQSAKALSGMDDDDRATSGGVENTRISESARQLLGLAGALEDFAARVLAQGGSGTHGWQHSLEQVMVSLRQERGRLMIMGRGLTREEQARQAAFGAAEKQVALAIEALRDGVPEMTAPETRLDTDNILAQTEAPATRDERQDLATRILENDRATLANAHVSGVNDDATARENIRDTSQGRPASRSAYGHAPGGTVLLDLRLLREIIALLEGYTFRVSEFAGGSHSPNSRHYAGVGVDISRINGRPVSASHPDVAGFKARCRQLGATEVLGPGDTGHSDHVHAAWPRP